MPKRHVARPVLESMENRMVLSVAGAATPAAEVVAARAARAETRAAHQTTVHRSKAENTAAHKVTAKAAHSTHHSSKSTSAGSTISNLLLKSIFPF
jgi:hypothetical protein